MDIITIGGATQDIFFNFSGTAFMNITSKREIASFMLFESGEKIEVQDIFYQSGGGATNSGVSFSRLGLKTTCFCSIGTDCSGDTILKELAQENIDTSKITQSQTHQTGTSVIVNSQHGERTVFAYRGANRHLILNEIHIETIKACKQVYITSLSNESATLLPTISSLARQHNIPVAINPGMSQLATGTEQLKESLKSIDTLILNSNEARTFMVALIGVNNEYKQALESSTQDNPCGLNMANRHAYLVDNPLPYENLYFSIRNFFKEVLKMGPSIVVITNGCNGVYVATKDELLFHPSLETTVVNSVGAGDAFGSCFIASLRLGLSIDNALRNGIINSASVLEHLGAKTGLLTMDQIEDRRKRLDPSLLQHFS